jgi:hypothetical protein
MKKPKPAEKTSPNPDPVQANKPWKEQIKDALAAKRAPEGWPQPKKIKKGG